MPDMHPTNAIHDIPDISEALNATPMPHSKALALRRQVAGSVLCAVLKSTKWVRQLRNLGDSTAPIRIETLPRGTIVVGYLATRAGAERVDLAAEMIAAERRELVDSVTSAGREARGQWHLKHVKKR